MSLHGPVIVWAYISHLGLLYTNIVITFNCLLNNVVVIDILNLIKIN